MVSEGSCETTEVVDAENSAFPSQEKKIYTFYSIIENSYFKF